MVSLIESGRSDLKCVFVMVVVFWRVYFGFWCCVLGVVFVDFCVDVVVVFCQDVMLYVKFVVFGVFVGGFLGVWCVVGKI